MAESLFTSQTPSSADNSDGGAAGITTSTTLTFAAAGQVSAIRFYATTTVTSGETYTAELWSVTNNNAGTLLASKAVAGSAITAGTWNVITFDTPVSVTATTAYRAALNNNHNGGRYVATSGFFTSAGLTNGNITGIQDGASPFGAVLSNGVFVDNAAAGTFPNLTFGAASYFVDVVYTQSGTGTAAGTLGALQGVATGVRTVLGTAAASLGGLVASAFAGSTGSAPRLVSASSSSRITGGGSSRIVSTTKGGRL